MLLKPSCVQGHSGPLLLHYMDALAQGALVPGVTCDAIQAFACTAPQRPPLLHLNAASALVSGACATVFGTRQVLCVDVGKRGLTSFSSTANGTSARLYALKLRCVIMSIFYHAVYERFVPASDPHSHNLTIAAAAVATSVGWCR